MKFKRCLQAIPAYLGLALAGAAASPTMPHPQSVVEVQMQAVNLHLDQYTVLEVRRLRGQMVPTRGDQPVTFDDATSFKLRLSSAEIAVSATALSDLLNHRVFNYPGSPLRDIRTKIENGRIEQKGTVHKGITVSFEVVETVSATPDGEIRFHAQKITSGHVPVKGLLHLLGEDLSALVNIKKGRGMRVEGDDILIHPGRILPPPQIDSKVSVVRVEGDRIVMNFQSHAASQLNPPYKSDSYIYHRGGVLRFGKLTMTDADLEIVSDSHQKLFDFSLPEYDRQLVAGYSKNTASHGLIVFMGDLKALGRTKGNESAAAPGKRG
jgi:hypothetical protein